MCAVDTCAVVSCCADNEGNPYGDEAVQAYRILSHLVENKMMIVETANSNVGIIMICLF